MSFENNFYSVPNLLASADLSAKQYRVVKIGATSGVAIATVAVATAATDAIVGVLQDKPSAAGQAAQVMAHGISRVVASAAVTRGAALTATTDGKVVTTTTAGHKIIGYAMEDAAADGDVIACLLQIGTI